MQGPPDAEVQREVAAALESVFPRVGLKAFLALSIEEKSSQVPCLRCVLSSPVLSSPVFSSPLLSCRVMRRLASEVA